jgi:hypothetical protein
MPVVHRLQPYFADLRASSIGWSTDGGFRGLKPRRLMAADQSA